MRLRLKFLKNTNCCPPKKKEQIYYTDKDDLVPYILIENIKNLPVIFYNEN